MEDKKIISMRQIMKDLVNKQKNDGISKELWMIKKRWVWDELWKINNLYETNYRRFGQTKKMMVYRKNYG